MVRIKQLVKFCLVGASGVIVDMVVLFFLADPHYGNWDVNVSKVSSAEAAMLNNFFWNELWTFRGVAQLGLKQRMLRLVKFHGICSIGIALAVFFLHLFHVSLGFNLYLSNLLAILIVTVWNFSLNAIFNWTAPKKNTLSRELI